MTIGILGNTSKPALKDVASELLSYLCERNVPHVLRSDLWQWLKDQDVDAALAQATLSSDSDLASKCDLLIALGGDGTMLEAAHTVGLREIPILGVNLGKLGFLAEISVDEMRSCLDDLLANRLIVESRLVLEAMASDGKTYHALNEIVVHKGASSRVIECETYVNNDYLVTYAADGIIVNTPTGSTAYSLASGGPIVTPHSNVFTINPIAPHTLTARPVIVPHTSGIRIVVRSATKEVHITADGQSEGFYSAPTEFIIRNAPFVVKLMKRRGRTYYDLLRTKLMWGRDLRTEKK